jgi:hypothetical protein
MITVVAGGDSFVYGSELADCMDRPKKNIFGHSNSTFAALLSKDFVYECLAWPGYANTSISRTMIEYCELQKNKNLFVMVSWTFPGRYEFRFSYDTQQKKSPWQSINTWTMKNDPDQIKSEYTTMNQGVHEIQIETINRAKATGLADFAKTFYKHVGGSEYWEIYSSLKEIVYLQNYLKLKTIPFMFTCADTVLFYHATKRDSVLDSLFNQIDFDKWFFFPGGNEWETTEPRGFYQWAIENKYPVGTTHPLEQAHRDAAQLMKEKFNELVKTTVQ